MWIETVRTCLCSSNVLLTFEVGFSCLKATLFKEIIVTLMISSGCLVKTDYDYDFQNI